MTQKFLYSTNLRHLLKSHSELQLYFLYSNFFFLLYKHLYFLTNPFEFLTSCSFPSPWIYVCAYSWLHVNYIRSKGNTFSSVQFSSVAQSCPTLCDPMNHSMPGFPVHHQLPELTQTYVYWVGDAIQPSHPLLSPFPPALNLSQHQGFFPMSQLFTSGAKVLEFLL